MADEPKTPEPVAAQPAPEPAKPAPAPTPAPVAAAPAPAKPAVPAGPSPNDPLPNERAVTLAGGVFTMSAPNHDIFLPDVAPGDQRPVKFRLAPEGALWMVPPPVTPAPVPPVLVVLPGAINKTYWARYLTPTTFTLYDTKANAFIGSDVGRLAADGSVANAFVYRDPNPVLLVAAVADEIKDWTRREIALARAGHSDMSRAAINP